MHADIAKNHGIAKNAGRGVRLGRSLVAVAACLFAPLTHAWTAALTPPAAAADPFIWLEAMESPRALDWVKAENERSLAILKGDPRFGIFEAEALKILDAADRIPAPDLIGDKVYNFWQDADHVRGLSRRTTPAGFALADPPWETVLDLDALSAAEGKNWVWKGAHCPAPRFDRCLVVLSDGGEDASRVREFDLTTKAFRPGGFDLPRSKQTADWLDDDTLIVARDWGPGALTTSGYPFIVKTLKRGQSLDDAHEVFRGEPGDVAVDPHVLRDAAGDAAVVITRALSFFEAEAYLLQGGKVRRLPLPAKFAIDGLVAGRLIVSLKEAWRPTPAGTVFPQGSLVAVDLADLRRGDAPRIELLLAPGPRQSIEQVVVTGSRVVAAVYDNVRGALRVFTPGPPGEAWRGARLETPANASVHVTAAGEVSDALYFTVDGFLNPTRLDWADAATGQSRPIKTLPARFAAEGLMVEQFEAASSDGVRVPYFTIHAKNMRLDGANPTLLYAYGGFEVSMLPAYSGTVGKLWLERGGVYVVANIRGGGEFGPAWHEAGLKTHRQIIYDDFTAVARDLIARKITSPRRLGIEGGSNGGLLMGVEMTQHPELWRAVVIQVPLLDMLRFEQIGAGASWVGEYGSVNKPDEAAFLAAISPYHQLKAGVAYPEPFFVTSTKDDRVSPAHARKMAARMKAMGLPYLYFENTDGGHAASANLRQRAERAALEFTYLARKLID